jgi:sigma-E factor negative regulatory protein RseA
MVMDRISALMDGELDAREAAPEIAQLKNDAELRRRWDEFHLVGDALRGELMLSPGFGERFSRRLADEPTVLAPRRTRPDARRVATYAMSAAASISAAALVAWVALAPQQPGENVALQPAPPLPAPRVEPARELASVPSEGRMNEYLLAHEAFSPSTAIQGLAPYIRSVAATRPAERR